MVAGALLFAIFLVLAWGALRNSASADGAPVAEVRPPAASPAGGRASQIKRPPAAAATTPAVSGSSTTQPAPLKVKPIPATKVAVQQPSAAATWHAGRPNRLRLVGSPAGGTGAAGPTASTPAPGAGAPPTLAQPASGLRPPKTPRKAAGLAAAGVKVKAGSGSGNATSALVAPPVVSQCNGIGNAGGQAVACTVTVINNIDLASGASLSSVTVNQCTGAANAPLTCVASTTISNQVVQAVTQCNGSGSGGGGTVTCSVEIINNIFGSATSLPATVNQCNGSGQGGGANTLACSPTGATTNATVTQCDGSGNGGGGPTRVQCTVTPSSTQTPALPVTVDQCNGSANGGGATVTCTVSLTNSFFPALLFPGDLLPPGPGTGFPVAPPIGGPPGGPPGQGPPGRATAVALRQGTATAFLTPAGSTGRSAAAGSLARTGVDSRSMSVVALLSTLVGGLLVGLGRRKRRVGTVATS